MVRYDTGVKEASPFYREVRMPLSVRTSLTLIGWGLLWLPGCRGREKSCSECGTVVVAATGEPASLVPPLVGETVGRDISDQIFEHLAVLAPGATPIDPTAYRPGLADKW